MSFSVPALRRAYLTRTWRDIIGNHPYVAVVQLTGGRSWGRTNMKARILGDLFNSSVVNAKYAVPWAARAGAEETRFKGLETLFKGAPSAVVYGNEISAVLDVVERARNMIDGAILLGGRFGDQIVPARVWDEVASMGTEDEVRIKLVQLLSSPPGFLRVMDGNALELTRALQNSSASASSLVRILERHAVRVGENDAPTSS